MPVYENERGTFLFNSKDLCMIGHIPDLLEAGIDSLKIEGRMKNALYVATVTRTYRKAIDDCLKDRKRYEDQMDWYRKQIESCTHREYCTGFYYGRPDENAQIYGSSTYCKDYVYLGIAREAGPEGYFSLEQKNKFSLGETVEIMKPDGRNIETKVLRIQDEEGNDMESAPHARQMLRVLLGEAPEQYDILRRKG